MLRSKPEARLVNLSSIFAMVSMPTQGLYNASKAAVRGFSDALRLELSDTSVGVLCVHPGGIRTRIAELARIGDIALTNMSADELRRNFEHKLARTSAAEAARQIVHAIERDRTRLLIGADAHLIDLLYRLFPRQASSWVRALARRQQART
jgi:short-subunit dehydrogenase